MTSLASIHLCSGCPNLAGPGTPYKLLRCSNCDAAYCSSACQHNHWSIHRPVCRALQAREQVNAERTLAKPLAAALHRDTSEYFSEIFSAVWTAARSGLRIGHPKPLNTTSALLLLFRYSRRPANLRDRFTYIKAEVAPLDRAIKGPSSQQMVPMEKLNRTRKQELAEGMATGLCVMGVVDQDVNGGGCKVYEIGTTLLTSSSVPFDYPLNPIWPSTLQSCIKFSLDTDCAGVLDQLDTVSAGSTEVFKRGLKRLRADPEDWRPTMKVLEAVLNDRLAAARRA